MVDNLSYTRLAERKSKPLAYVHSFMALKVPKVITKIVAQCIRVTIIKVDNHCKDYKNKHTINLTRSIFEKLWTFVHITMQTVIAINKRIFTMGGIICLG